jgi:hypothetical protein
MSRRQLFAVAALVILLLGGLAAYLWSQAEPYETTVDQGPAPEARQNPYLAAEHFLQRQGRKVQSTESLELLASLPSQGHSLLLLSDRPNMTRRQAERLLAWTEQGGHLLVIADRMWDEQTQSSGDPLLDPLGIQQFPSDTLDSSETLDATPPSSSRGRKPSAHPSAAPSATSADTDAYPQLTRLYLENEQAPAYFAFDPAFHLVDSQDRAHAWANSSQATHMLQLAHGEGLITVLTDPWLWQNDHIDDYDNAWLLWYLTQDSAVTLVHRSTRDHLFQLLQRHFPEALLALALLIGLGLWHFGQRQGPLLLPQPQARRQLQEHLRASADFLLRRSGQRSLLQALQQDIQRRARQRHPGFERLGVAEQWQVLGRLTRQPASAIGQALRPPPATRQSATLFTRQVAYLQTLRNAL